MYKNLNPSSLGVTGRQSELIELALTYRFRGLDLEAGEIVKRALVSGVEEAARYIHSGQVKVGGWVQPVDLSANAQTFAKQIERLPALGAAAKEIGFTYCTLEVKPVSDELPYHENFEQHRERLQAVAEALAPHGIRAGLALRAAPEHRAEANYQFIHQAEELLTLIRTIGAEPIGLALDTWNWQVGGGGSDQLAELTGQQIVSITIADVPLDADVRSITDKQRLLPTEDSIPRHGKMLRSLVAQKYAGPVTLRPHPSHLSKLPRDASVNTCAKLLEQIWVAAGLSKAVKPPEVIPDAATEATAADAAAEATAADATEGTAEPAFSE
jgi:sugar phosphate isomerase/epimerase